MGRRNGILALAAATLVVSPSAAHASTFVAELGSPFPTRPNSFGLLARDFNGDNRPDVAVVNGIGSDSVSVYLRGAGGGFAEQPGSPFGTDAGANYAASADFDGVNGPDLAVAEFDSNAVLVLLHQSGGGYAIEGRIAAPGGASAVATGDFNADGRPDLVIGDWRTGDVIVALRNQQTGFTAQQPIDLGANPRQFAVADFNGDRAPDVAVAMWGERTVKVLLGTSSGGFSLESTTTVGEEPYGLGTGDFNGDGRPDIAVSNSASSTVRVLFRDTANSGFAATGPIGVPAGPKGVTVADFDSDGTPDVAVASQTANTVTILRGGTVPEAPIALGGGPYGVATADFNADSRPDLAVSANAGSFTPLLNTTTQPPPPDEPPAPQPPAPAPPPAQLPDPVAGQTVNALPKSGTVRIRLPRTNRFVELEAGRQIPVGTTVDTRQGRVTLVAAGRGGTADFFAGQFRISQTRGSRPLTTLTLTEQLSCPRRASAAQRRTKTRKLWGDGRGRFRTVGRYSAATVRGTRWLTQDRCNSTLTRVRAGAVNVRDQVLRRTVIVRAGRSYIARRRR
jgi:hypothetical protein